MSAPLVVTAGIAVMVSVRLIMVVSMGKIAPGQ